MKATTPLGLSDLELSGSHLKFIAANDTPLRRLLNEAYRLQIWATPNEEVRSALTEVQKWWMQTINDAQNKDKKSIPVMYFS